jgi:preprotein translocase subunit SecG
MKQFLLILQIIVSVGLIVLILIQSKGAGLGTAFGADATFYRSRRGVEKMFVYLTVAFVVLFFTLSILQVVL